MMSSKILFIVAPSFKKNSGYKVRVNRLINHFEKVGVPCEVHVVNSFTSFFSALLKTFESDYKLCFFENIGMVSVALFNPFKMRKFVLDYHGSIYDAAHKPFFKLRKFVYKFFEKLSICFFAKIIVVSNSFKKKLIDENPDKKTLNKNIIVIKNLPNLNPNLINQIDGYSQKDTIRLGYVGNYQSWQKIPEIIDFVDFLNNSTNQKIILNIATAEKAWFNEYLTKRNLSFKWEITYVENEALFNFLNKQTFLLMLREEDEINYVACPTKAIEYLMSFTPLITSKNLGDISGIVKTKRKGVVLESPWDSKKNIELIHLFLNNYNRFKDKNLFSLNDYDNLDLLYDKK